MESVGDIKHADDADFADFHLALTITLSLTEDPQPYVTDKKELISCLITEKRLSLQPWLILPLLQRRMQYEIL